MQSTLTVSALSILIACGGKSLAFEASDTGVSPNNDGSGGAGNGPNNSSSGAPRGAGSSGGTSASSSGVQSSDGAVEAGDGAVDARPGSGGQMAPCSATCPGCCDVSGDCNAGRLNSACGTNGQTCNDCTYMGRVCTSGT